MNFEKLYKIISKRKEGRDKNSYVFSLLEKGDNSILQKIGEEAIELIIAAKNKSKKEIIFESTDLIFFVFVLLLSSSVNLKDIYNELELRNRKSRTKNGIQNEGNVSQVCVQQG